ncbi:MAG: tlde1 domain-containing protein [Pseudolabrys sp.]
MRFAVKGALIGAGILIAAGLSATTVTLTAAWLVRSPLAANSQINGPVPLGPAELALVKADPAAIRLAQAASPARRVIATADDANFKSTRGGAEAFAPALPRSRPQIQAQPPKPEIELANVVPLPRAHPARDETITTASIGTPAKPVEAPKLAVTAPPPVISAPPTQLAHNKAPALPQADSRTALYDITGSTVYLPNGKKLEAHSGLGDKIDDPRYIKVRMRGATPPNVYDLTLREELFHGVRAIRLNPIDEDKMHGRDGMLAHTYMLGPTGQSNGCVSFKDYKKFLEAFQNGEVDRLVVVADLGKTPWRTAVAQLAPPRREPTQRYAANEPPVDNRSGRPRY